MNWKQDTDRQTQLGATLLSNGQTQFSVWAPKANQVDLELIQRRGQQEHVLSTHPLQRLASDQNEGIYSGTLENCPADSLYRFKLNNNTSRPDPRSRFQPFGVHGPSQVIDPNSYHWNDTSWKGIAKQDLVVYELHVGSFSEEGTYNGALKKLGQLKELGITAIELLPLAQCPGKWNWGYDGVNYFAPSNNFGKTNELKAFVDACHQAGFAVLVDVVYNHVGPEGNYLSEFGPYRSKKFGTPWGDAFAFDLAPVRQYVIDNVLFWIEEYHFDGLRLDAVHYMFDECETHILDEIRATFKQFSTSLNFQTHLIGESNIYDSELVGDSAGGNPNYDAIWSDCLMHSIYKTGAPELRLTDRHYEQADISQALEHAYVFSTPNAIRVTPEIRTQHHPQGDRRYIESLIMALQTHDSVGNHPQGKRIHQLTSLNFQMAAAPLILLYPSIPMIFMGEEWASDAPFPFFADFEDQGLRQAVDQGRRNEYPHHDWSASPLPSDPTAFTSSKSQLGQHQQSMFDWYQQLLAFRKSGLKEGWLCIDNWSTESDAASSVHQLIYRHPQGELRVCSRLARGAVKPVLFEELGVGKILFNSKPKTQTGLVAEHCLIWVG